MSSAKNFLAVMLLVLSAGLGFNGCKEHIGGSMWDVDLMRLIVQSARLTSDHSTLTGP